ncbi:hypothetical protein CBM2586_B130540 [Cupriavidus phytorum]|uniref:Uncharacterized protein n=1 Tax=Cupriavidus taiwanensis TaxID=164546 RepID=A0A975XIJ6_9BURK|nr:hypothetical protein CBM2586_B130540 [Cupriavidus taiwanensis]
MPDVPSISETVPGYDVSNYFGLWGAAGISPELTRRIAGLFADAAKSEKARDAFYSVSGTAVRTSTPLELAEYQRHEAQNLQAHDPCGRNCSGIAYFIAWRRHRLEIEPAPAS